MFYFFWLVLGWRQVDRQAGTEINVWVNQQSKLVSSGLPACLHARLPSFKAQQQLHQQRQRRQAGRRQAGRQAGRQALVLIDLRNCSTVTVPTRRV